jgi:hypothetical protein
MNGMHPEHDSDRDEALGRAAGLALREHAAAVSLSAETRASILAAAKPARRPILFPVLAWAAAVAVVVTAGLLAMRPRHEPILEGRALTFSLRHRTVTTQSEPDRVSVVVIREERRTLCYSRRNGSEQFARGSAVVIR